jgi:hypothetical protein
MNESTKLFFQGTFKLISITGQVHYLRWQIIEHLDHRIARMFTSGMLTRWILVDAGSF